MNIIIKALDILEREAHRLKGELKKGKRLEWKDVKVILKALGILAENKEIQDEAAKKSLLYLVGLNTFAAFVRTL